MPSSLRSRLGELASAFAAEVVEAIRASSLQELLSQSGGSARGRRGVGDALRPLGRGRRGVRLARRSEGDIEKVIEQITALLRKHRDGLRAEQIREELGLQAKELPRPLKEGLSSGRFGKSGRKRATLYFLKGEGAGRSAKSGGGHSGSRAAAASPRRGGKRKKRAREGADRAGSGSEKSDKKEPSAPNGAAAAG